MQAAYDYVNTLVIKGKYGHLVPGGCLVICILYGVQTTIKTVPVKVSQGRSFLLKGRTGVGARVEGGW